VWPWRELRGVKWLNNPQHPPPTGSKVAGKGWELAIINLMDCHDDKWRTEKFYSHPVILVTVPKVADRELAVEN